MASPTSVSRGSTTQPLTRSSTTDANEPGVSPVVAPNRLTRTTSPPIVEGSTLLTNIPARYCETNVRSRARSCRTSATRCQRTAATTTATSISARPESSHANVLACHWGSRAER